MAQKLRVLTSRTAKSAGKRCIFCDFLSFFCKKRALFAIFCTIFVFFAISFTILGGVRAFSLSRVYGGERFLKMGELVKMGKISLSRGFFAFGGFLGGGRAFSL